MRTSDIDPPPGLLAGITVLDISAYLPGPYTTRLLADLGADVIKLEHPAGDPIRSFMPGVYEFLNRGKRIVTVDLKKSEGRDLALEMARCATCSSRRSGLGSSTASVSTKHRSPPSCLTWSTARSLRTARQGRRATGSGTTSGSRPPVESSRPPSPQARCPRRSPTALADTGAACFAALTICAALVRREARTEPLRLDVSLEEVVAYLAAPRWGRALARGADSTSPVESASHAPGNGLFLTADHRHLALAGVEDHLWAATCRWLGVEELARPPYDRHEARMAHRDDLRAAIAKRVLTRTAQDWLAQLGDHDVPVELARNYDEVLDDRHLRERGFVREGPLGCVLEFPVRVGGSRSTAGDEIRAGRDVVEELLIGLGLDAGSRAELVASGALPEITVPRATRPTV